MTVDLDFPKIFDALPSQFIDTINKHHQVVNVTELRNSVNSSLENPTYSKNSI